MKSAGLDSETEIVYYREGSEPNVVRKTAGLSKYSNIVLKRGVTKDSFLWDWRKQVTDGNTKRLGVSFYLTRPGRRCFVGISAGLGQANG